MTEIPQFSLEESEEIGALLTEEEIPYERRCVITSSGRAGFIFSVQDDRFLDAIRMIKSHCGFLDAPPEPVSGTCPACNFPVTNAFECPDCGLSLSFNPRELMQNHPFVIFLTKLEKETGTIL
ncbi:MAG: hypothetical protein MUC65_10200 [Pontiellaceae bacterium]|jgi:rubredoxin|nr:hypothetical protein [Pontiellaceae bacterium]